MCNMDSKQFCAIQSEFESKEAYYKAIGYRENDGQIESTNDYLKRLESYMKLYGALVQVHHYSWTTNYVDNVATTAIQKLIFFN